MAGDKEIKEMSEAIATRDRTDDSKEFAGNNEASRRLLQDANSNADLGKKHAGESSMASKRMENEDKIGKITLGFQLPENIASKAHPQKGEGYYQPLAVAGKELLGRELEHGEIRALVSASRAMRQKQGKSVNSLSTKDLVMPQSDEELQTFIENIGNSKHGQQAMGKTETSKLKDEVSSKFESLHKEQKKDKPEEKPEPTPEQKDKPVPVAPPEPNVAPAEPKEKLIPIAERKEKPIPIVLPEQKDKPGEQAKQREISGPFTNIKPEEAAKILNTPSGKDLPPIAERFEEEALKQLGPEAKPTIYVSKDPADKNIPQGATKYRSISDAVSKAPAGSVIQVMPGVYDERIKLGEKSSNITIQTDRGNPAVINGGSFQVVSNAHDITIRNFEVKNFSVHGAGIRIDGSNIHNIIIAGNNVHSASNAEGIAVYGRPGTPVSGVSIIGNRVHDLRLAELEAVPINGNVDGFKVIGNSGFRLNNLFIDVIGGEGNGGNRDQARNGTIAYNFADGISSRYNPSYNEYSAGGLYVDGGKQLEIYGNYIRNSDFGIEIGSEHRGLNASGVNVHNNIFERSNLVWLKLGYKGGVDNSTIKENLVLGNSPSSVEKEGPVAPSTKVQDNLGAKDRNSVTRIPSLIWDRVKIGTGGRLALPGSITPSSFSPLSTRPLPPFAIPSALRQ